MERSEIFRALAMIALIGVFMMTLAVINRRHAAPSAAGPGDLSSELRRCRAIGPQDVEEAHCAAVWGESRRRFFGRPARPLQPPTVEKESAAPATSNEAVSGDAQ